MEIDETAANPSGESEVAPALDAEANAPAGGEGEQSPDSVDDLDALIGDDPEAGKATPELLDIEYDGKTYKLPPELKDALLRQSDYTRKTMDIAEQRRAIEATKAETDQLHSISQERLAGTIRHQQLTARVEQIESTPIDSLTAEQITALRIERQELIQEAHNTQFALQQMAAFEEQTRGQQLAKAREAALSEAAKRIPNFTDERRQQLETLAIQRGSSQADVAAIADPTVWEILHFADIGMKFTERQRAAAKVKAAQSAQPAPEVGGKASPKPAGLSDDLPIEEWNKRRNAQLARR